MRFETKQPISHPSKMWWLITFIAILLSFDALAHPMPNTAVLVDIKGNKVSMEMNLPLSELELAFGHDVNRRSDGLVARLGPQLSAYLLQHIHPFTPEGKAWNVTVDSMRVQPVQDSPSGPYKELTVLITLLPPPVANTRQFTLNYDVIIHQVSSHFALFSLRQDWDNGKNPEHPYEVGVVRLDIKNNVIHPLQVDIEEGNLWLGFTSMVNLGIEHIKEGTDHLLFLLTLLLPAALIVKGGRWAEAGSTRYSLVRILKIVTAFTLGHSITLLIGATGLINFPGWPIEILIAVSILVSAVHAIKPIFPGKEMYIAAGFGLIHGMAFAATLVNLDLDAGRTALSILGFNIGIELMQLFVIAVTMPWLIILSRSKAYDWIRITGAMFAGIAAIAWLIERVSLTSNPIAAFVGQAAEQAKWAILFLGIISMISLLTRNQPSLSRK